MAGVWPLLKLDINLCSRGTEATAPLHRHGSMNTQSLVWQWLPEFAQYPNRSIRFIWQLKQPLGIFAILMLTTLLLTEAWQGAAA